MYNNLQIHTASACVPCDCAYLPHYNVFLRIPADSISPVSFVTSFDGWFVLVDLYIFFEFAHISASSSLDFVSVDVLCLCLCVVVGERTESLKRISR